MERHQQQRAKTRDVHKRSSKLPVRTSLGFALKTQMGVHQQCVKTVGLTTVGFLFFLKLFLT